jgi:hypothetical protein
MRVNSQAMELGVMSINLTSTKTYDVMRASPYFDEE